MSRVCILAVLISFGISSLLGPVVIPWLKRLKIGQTVREDGPAAHLKKNGTPTMGGVLILLGVSVTTLIFLKDYPGTAPILFLTVGFGLIGFLDDYIKVLCRRSMGLTPLQKLTGQIGVTALFAWYLLHYTDVSLAMRVPFFPDRYLDFGVWNLPILFFIVLGTVNGVNFTDGLDGLAGSVTLMVTVFFTAVAIGERSGIEPVTCAERFWAFCCLTCIRRRCLWEIRVLWRWAALWRRAAICCKCLCTLPWWERFIWRRFFPSSFRWHTLRPAEGECCSRWLRCTIILSCAAGPRPELRRYLRL